ncbi:MAG: heme exporter protein CcmD [Alphaproteobacteria bacterium]|jgi:heme exporter protein D|nr:heme exporter protein CcmD [Alphaproteobacteria bacterium]MDP6566948.1 heme exporter protein CcmD [Alphaproteobacteria bacterium]MDP6813748.1 heme exporter protein CcmD [Alphaproteobacteria bacterium]
MAGLGDFLAMGGYAGYVWPAFGAALVVLALLWLFSVRGWRQSERTLAALREHRRRGGEDAAAGAGGK